MAKAMAEYDELKFSEAAADLRKLAEDFPENRGKVDLYNFLAALSDARKPAYVLGSDPAKALEGLEEFVKDHREDKNFDSRKKDLGKTYLKVAQELVNQAKTKLDLSWVEKCRIAMAEVRKFDPDESVTKMEQDLGQITEEIAQGERKKKLLADLDQVLQKPTREMVKNAEKIIHNAALIDPGLANDPDIKTHLDQMAGLVRQMVTWVPATQQPASINEKIEPILVVVPALVKATGMTPDSDRVVFALARGVLYALKQSTGEVLWYTRVGMDTTMLPVRLPATGVFPESVLVVSALSRDLNVLSKRDTRTGKPFWHYRLTGPCLGRPVVIDHRAFVPTYDGKVHEIETAEGKLTGWVDIGHPLTVGAVHQPGTNLLYVPEDSRNVYVLDINNHEKPCPAILDSGHPAGSLRSEPIIISRDAIRENQNLHLDPSEWPDYLVLNQADGLSAMKFRVFPLPVQGQANELSLSLLQNPIQGWPWFSPFLDGEKMIQVTDANVLGMIGINQVHNQDQTLFEMFLGQIPLGEEGRPPGRAQVVHCADSDCWVLAQGKMQKLHFNQFASKNGTQISPGWTQPLILGSPLHNAQVEENSKTLVVVTQSLGQQISLATAVNMETGQVRWQRQLGLISEVDPVVVGFEVLAVDARGSLLAFDSRHPPLGAPEREKSEGKTIAEPLEEGAATAYLVAGVDPASAYEIADSGHGTVIVRHYEGGKDKVETTIKVQSRLQGTPGMGQNVLVLPLASGDLLRFSFDKGESNYGPTWRAAHADEGAHCQVASLGGEEFLVTDGSRGLTRWRLPAGQTYIEEAKGDLPARILGLGVVKAPTKDHPEIQAVVAASDGTLTLIQDLGTDPNTPRPWQILRSWNLKGSITAGPFLRSQRIGCVVDQNHLVWIDPAKEGWAWEFNAGEGIVGQPQMVADLLVVATLKGRFLGLDLNNGQPRWKPGYQLKEDVAPSRAPVPFGPDQALAPLTDGTLLLLSIDQLKPPLAAFDPFW